MAPHTTPAMYEVGYALHQLLQGTTDIDDLRTKLRAFAVANGYTRASGGTSQDVYLGADVVVKIPYRSIGEVPEEYRPEEFEAFALPPSEPRWEGDDGAFAFNRVVVQPRYRSIFDNPGADDASELRSQFLSLRYVAQDAHEGNWGLRPDNTPVLFDW